VAAVTFGDEDGTDLFFEQFRAGRRLAIKRKYERDQTRIGHPGYGCVEHVDTS
jgi:hypothetical protein